MELAHRMDELRNEGNSKLSNERIGIFYVWRCGQFIELPSQPMQKTTAK